MEPTQTSKAAPEQSTQQIPTGPDPDLTKELMVFLSKEIETTMTSLMAFRTRIGFGMFVGPFVLLSSFIVGAKGQPVSFNLTTWGWVAVVVDLACFLLIGIVAANIELQAFGQCNRWRSMMLRLRDDPSAKIADKELQVIPWAYLGYLCSFLLLFVSVAATVVILKNAKPVEASKSTGAAPVYRIEQVSPAER
jgi:hypothetical protein